MNILNLIIKTTVQYQTKKQNTYITLNGSFPICKIQKLSTLILSIYLMHYLDLFLRSHVVGRVVPLHLLLEYSHYRSVSDSDM